MRILLTLAMSALWMMTPDLSGTWDLEMSWPNAKSTGVCALKQDGEKLSGTCGGGDAKFPATGEVKGNKATWEVAVEQGGHKGNMSFSGIVDEAGTAIHGTCVIAGGSEGTFAMKRQ